MRNIGTTDNIQIDGTEIEKMTNYTYLRQTKAMENRIKQEVSIRINNRTDYFQRTENFFLDRHLAMSLKRKVFDQCVLPAVICGCQT